MPNLKLPTGTPFGNNPSGGDTPEENPSEGDPSNSSPLIPSPTVPEVRPANFENPNCPGDDVSGIITMTPAHTSILLDRQLDIQYIVFTNQTTGSTFTEWIYRTTFVVNAMSYCNSNGYWKIEIVTASGQHYVTSFMVNNSAFGPLVPCDWIDGDDAGGTSHWNMGPF